MQHTLSLWMRRAFVALGLVTAFGITSASANVTADVVAIPVQAFYFKGVCTDCIGVGNAELYLTTNYAIGTSITSANFVSFHYDGTNLLSAFTIDAAHLSYIYGAINPPLPGPENITIGSNASNMQFISSSSGFWCVGGACLSDTGAVSAWSVTPAGAATVPEPMSGALLGAGLVAACVVRRQRHRAGRSA